MEKGRIGCLSFWRFGDELQEGHCFVLSAINIISVSQGRFLIQVFSTKYAKSTILLIILRVYTLLLNEDVQGLPQRLRLHLLQQLPLLPGGRRIPHRHRNRVTTHPRSNEEYCYCVVSTDPKETGVIVIAPESADFSFHRKLYLGETSMMNYRFRQVVRDLSEEYTCGSYHMFEKNCNHFTDSFARKLLGMGIPQWLFRSTDILALLCCCLPRRLTSGQWALESLIE